MSENGEIHLMNLLSYQDALIKLRMLNLVMIAAPRGIPRKTATLVATVE